MSTKITITNIENIDWARRLIITFYVHQTCYDPVAGGWQYIDDGCGYRNVCDNSWIELTPNTQHPLHSSVIKYAGEYRYVWDYGGVFGLDPANFDSQHSYLIQIALVDSSCNYFDPCANTTYITQYGQEPQGIPNTYGDINNTSNNCGPNFFLKADTNGCLFCEPIPQTGTVSPTDPDGIISYTPVSVSRPFEKPPFNQSSFGISWDLIEDQSAYFGKNIPPVENNQEASDTPISLILSSGPPAPGTQVDNLSGSYTVFGNKNNPFPDSYDYYRGHVIPSKDNLGPGANISGAIIGHSLGGISPSINPPTTMNAKVPLIAANFISDYNASINARRAADQLNLNPNQIPGLDGVGLSEVNPSTKVRNAITISDSNQILLRGKDRNILSQNNNYNFISTISDEVSNKPPKNSRDPSIKYDSPIQASPDKSSSLDFSSSRFNKSINKLGDLNLESISYTQDNIDFYSNFIFSAYIPSLIRTGDKLFMDINIVPKHTISYDYIVKGYIASRNMSYELFSTNSKTRSGSIRVAKNFDINIKSGSAVIVIIVKDSSGNTVAAKKYPINILDASTNDRGIFSTPLSINTNSTIRQLINVSSSINAPIGEPNNYIEYILNVIDGDSTNIDLAVLVTSSDPSSEHAITIYDNSNVYINTGKLKIDGISVKDSYSGALYVQVPRSSVSSTLRLRISNTKNYNSFVTIGLGKDLKFSPLVISTYSFNYTSNIYRVTVDSSMLYSTKITLFPSGNENFIPTTIPTQASVTTSSTGSFQQNVRSTDKGWIGMAYTYPTSVPLAKRIITYIKGGRLYS